jgi:menaquinone-dependent protoporphyrinogen IX oxidase
MKAAVVYDSYYGNTELVAQTIASELRAQGHEAQLVNIHEEHDAPLPADILFVGSPVRFGSTTKKAKQFVEKLDKPTWMDKPLVVFTTILAQPEKAGDKQKASREKFDIGAGRKLVELAKAEGLNAVQDHLWVDVKGLTGPLVETGREESRHFTREVLGRLAP